MTRPCEGAHLWLLADTGTVDDAMLLDACEAPLDAAERERLAGFGSDSRRREFLLGHALARVALRRLYPAEQAREWRIGIGDGGRPEPASSGGRSAALSIAHTRGLLAAAVAAGGELGVDVEWCGRAPAALDVAERFFADEETRSIRAADGAAQVERFLGLWTMKEAYLKARGAGLRLPLRDIVFSMPAGAAAAWSAKDPSETSQPAIGVRFADTLHDQPARWTLRQWAHMGGHLVGFAHGGSVAPAVPRLHELDRVGLLAALRESLTSR